MNTPNNKLKEVLDQLSVESWQLELVVSGFAVFLAGSSLTPIYRYGSKLHVVSEGINSDFGFLTIFAMILLACVFFIFINLILHIIFRGMWISAIGLRSISGEIDFEELSFARPFDKFMRKKLKSFDAFIQRLEDISSVIFAFTFLIVFMVISLGLFSFFIGIIAYFINGMDADTKHSEVYGIIGGFLIIIFLFSALLYFIDFITLGFFKKKRWIAIWYFPIYRLFSLITFSWLYRPLYYNLIDNKFGRRIGFFLVPYFIFITSMAMIQASLNLYIPKDKKGFEINDKYFDDTRDKEDRIQKILMPSKYIKNGFLELFLTYQARKDDEAVELICPNAIPDEVSGLRSTIRFGGQKEDKYHTPIDSLLNCVSQIYKVYINDSLYQNIDYYFYKDNHYNQEGIKTIIDLQHLKRGRHLLKVEHLNLDISKDSTISFEPYVQSPIWLE